MTVETRKKQTLQPDVDDDSAGEEEISRSLNEDEKCKDGDEEEENQKGAYDVSCSVDDQGDMIGCSNDRFRLSGLQGARGGGGKGEPGGLSKIQEHTKDWSE